MKYRKYIFATSLLILHNANAMVELKKVSFPKTIADVPREIQIENAKIGYKPFEDQSAYVPIEMETEEEAMERYTARLEAIAKLDAARLTHEEYCDKYPTDEEKCVQKPGLEQELISMASQPTIYMMPNGVLPMQNAANNMIANNNATTTPATNTATTTTPGAVTPNVATSGQLVGYSMSGQPVYANPTIVNGPCTPSETDTTGWPNKIFTSGKYQSIDQGFEKIMNTIFRKEGTCGNDPDDAGGFTCYGISSRANPDIDVSSLTRPKVEDITYERYYKKYNFDKLPDSVRDIVFLAGWGCGLQTGIKRFQRFLGVSATGKIDEATINAAKNYQGDIHHAFTEEHKKQLVEASKKRNNKKFLKGWMRGVHLYHTNGCHYPTKNPLKR